MTTGLNALALHLFACADERLLALIDKDWMLGCSAARGVTFTGFLHDAELAWQAATAQEEQNVPTLVRIEAARNLVQQRASLHPDTDLQILALLDRGDNVAYALVVSS